MKGNMKIIISMLIFGSIGIFVRGIELSSIEIAFLRAIIGSFLLIGASCFVRQKISIKGLRENMLLLILSGGAIGFNWILLFQGYRYTTISNATLSYYFAPIIVILLAPFILKERLT
jgi:drug/metabolite transporter (DMT)-like permease